MSMWLELFLAVVLLVISLSVSLFFTVPFVGTLVRYRANYTPKGLQLDQDGGLQPHVGPVVNGYWAMFMRVRRLEGFRGFYKGLMPNLLGTLMLTVYAGLIMGKSLASTKTPGRYSVPSSGSIELVAYTAVLAALSIPFTIISNRAITTPRKLPWFNARMGLQVLLTPTERRQPWKMFLIPGLVTTQFLHIVYVVAIMHSLRRVILPSLTDYEPSDSVPADFTPLRFGLYFLIVCLSVTVLCPLEVIATRLSLQRCHGNAAEFSELPQEEQSLVVDEDGVEFAGKDEDVVGLRSEEDPYLGLADCARRIVREEGAGVLYRAWWVTLLGAFFGALL